MEDYDVGSGSIPYEPLTERELNILAHIADGLSNRQIAETLFLAHSTVRWYIRRIYSKLGVETRDEAVEAAVKMGLGTSEIEDAPVTRHNLPLLIDTFIGRERELQELMWLIADPEVRLITILAPGGMGKTRLALKLAESIVFSPQISENDPQEMLIFPDGVFLVPLEPISEPSLTMPMIAEYSGYRYQQDGREPKQQLLHYLREKRMLLILDNVEHLLDEAAIVSEILEAAPNLQIIATSRERLNLKSETLYVINGMDFQNGAMPERALECDTAKLFLQSAKRVKSGFTVEPDETDQLMSICRLVDGMPLAIELAAAWVDVLSLQEIASEITTNLDFLSTNMRDIPPRHHSIRAVFEYTWKRLSAAEQSALMKLAVFRGGCTREAAEEITGANLLLLRTLVNKSLIRCTPNGRYELHALLRQFAEVRLESMGELATTQIAYSRHYADILYGLNAQLRGAGQAAALDTIERDLENIRAGWQQAIDYQLVDVIARYLEGLYYYFDMRSRANEGVTLFSQAVALLRKAEPKGESQLLLGKALARQGSLAQRLGHYREAAQLLESSLKILRAFDKREEIAFVLNNLADIARASGQYHLAKQFCEDSLAIFRELGDEWSMTGALNNLGVVMYFLDLFAEADKYYRESLALSTRLGDKHGVAISLINLGTISHDQEQYSEAQHYYHESLKLCQQLDDQYGIAASINNLGRTAFMQGAYVEAKQYCEECLALYKRYGDYWGIAAALINLGDIVCALGDLQSARDCFHEALRTIYTIQAIPLIVEVVVGMVELLMQEEKSQQALTLLIPVVQNPPRDREIRSRADRLWTTLKADLPDELVSSIQRNYHPQPIEAVAEQIFGL